MFSPTAADKTCLAERLIFPWLNTKLDFGKEAEEHKHIHHELDRISALLDAAKADVAKFDAPTLARILHDLRQPLVSPTPLSRTTSPSRVYRMGI